MHFAIYLIFCLLLVRGKFSNGIKFSAESFAEISLLAKKGKTHLQSLREKANVPQFGPCWKNAISDLQIGCKFLSENVQSDLALRFTDCFLQMSGHEPLTCDLPKSVCLKKLSDRAFNAYTEFYTHTQSICYFLQSQIWHEETEKTIDKLSATSLIVSQKLKEAGEIQEKLLNQQKESLLLQHDLSNTSKSVATVLQSSQKKINSFMQDFQVTAAEQKALLIELFENLIIFRSWAVNEFSWFNSTVYFTTAVILTYFFTSVSRTREARMIIFIVFAFNYIFERLLTSSFLTNAFFGENLTVTPESLNSWIWLSRKFCICLGVLLLLYTAFSYYDYNVLNYQLLLEIKNQNLKILSHFAVQEKNQYVPDSKCKEMNNSVNCIYNSPQKINSSVNPLYASFENSQSKLKFSFNSQLQSKPRKLYDTPSFFSKDVVDSEENKSKDNVSVTYEEEDFSRDSKKIYNLRSHKSRKTSIY